MRNYTVKGIYKSLRRKALLQLKEFLWIIRPGRDHSKKILFIVGCQRSGTTMMSEVFELDLRAKVYGEFSKLSSEDYLGIRLNPLSSVEKVVKKQRAPLIVLKPLVESQNLTKLLSFFPGSKALWMYRHYKDVARSNLNKFGESNGIKDLRPIILNEDRNWRSEFVPDTVRHEVAKYFSEDFNLILGMQPLYSGMLGAASFFI